MGSIADPFADIPPAVPSPDLVQLVAPVIVGRVPVIGVVRRTEPYDGSAERRAPELASKAAARRAAECAEVSSPDLGPAAKISSAHLRSATALKSTAATTSHGWSASAAGRTAARGRRAASTVAWRDTLTLCVCRRERRRR